MFKINWSCAVSILSEACPPLFKPTSGNLTLVSNGTVSEGTYTCSSGYALIGDAKIICENGAWSGSEVRCGMYSKEQIVPLLK